MASPRRGGQDDRHVLKFLKNGSGGGIRLPVDVLLAHRLQPGLLRDPAPRR